jgi:hypothetical protein
MSRSAISKNFDKEHIYIVEVDVPRCKLVHGTAPCTATQTGNAKCYNTRATCNSLANYTELHKTGSIQINVNATAGTFTRLSGSFLTDGFAVGQTITTDSFSNAGNNSQFFIKTVTATVITVTNAYGMVTETGSGNEEIEAVNYFTYKFCSARSPHPIGLNNVAPCVSSVNVAPAKIDPAGGIGARASATITMNDFKGSDLNGVDPYLSGRTYIAYETGLFWSKWRARNSNYENYPVRILSGYIVQNAFARENFDERHYVLTSMTATNGVASLKVKDPLQLISNRSALAPEPSKGKLLTAITSTATSLTLEPTGVGASYPASGIAKIRSEVVTFTRSGDVLTIVRGTNNTVATDHSVGDTVQICLNYDGTKDVAEVQADLFVNYAKVPAIYIPLGNWKAEASAYISSNPNRLITTPTKVSELVAELCQQWSHKLFWNERAATVELSAIKAPPASANQLTYEKNIMELTTVDKPDMQVSTVFVHYGQFNPTKKKDEIDNYKVTFARVNSDAIARYNSNNTMVIYAPWINSANGAAARRLAQLHGRRFGIIPREVTLTVEDKDSDVWLGDIRQIIHPDICDRNGVEVATPFEIIQAAESDTYELLALEYNYDQVIPDFDDDVTKQIIDLSVNEQNINLLTKFTSVYGAPTAATEAIFIVYSGVVIGSSSTASAALLTGAWPAGAQVILQINSGGFVVGAGGDGSSSAAAGSNGGTAISMGYNMTVINNGVIGGGGGGGGYSSDLFGSVGGGGGAGNKVGLAGSDPVGPDVLYSVDPSNGSTDVGGNGGEITYSRGGEPYYLSGGNGGNLGQAGQNADSNGGAAGSAIVKNGYTLTQTVAGNIYGAII